jgi:hypothetical protein
MKPTEANVILPPADAGSDPGVEPTPDVPREDPVRQIMKDVMARRARGEVVSDDRVLAEHPPHLRRDL